MAATACMPIIRRFCSCVLLYVLRVRFWRTFIYPAYMDHRYLSGSYLTAAYSAARARRAPLPLRSTRRSGSRALLTLVLAGYPGVARAARGMAKEERCLTGALVLGGPIVTSIIVAGAPFLLRPPTLLYLTIILFCLLMFCYIYSCHGSFGSSLPSLSQSNYSCVCGLLFVACVGRHFCQAVQLLHHQTPHGRQKRTDRHAWQEHVASTPRRRRQRGSGKHFYGHFQ